MIRKALKSFLRIITDALSKGMTPHKLALTCALGVVISIFPIYGTTTLLCFIVAFVFRLNVVVIQSVNYLFMPAQLVLLFPFFRTGIFLFNLPPLVIGKDELMIRIKSDAMGVLQELGMVAIGGITAWMLLAIPLFIFFFFILRSFLSRFLKDESFSTVQIQE